jgi:hypothetical protein
MSTTAQQQEVHLSHFLEAHGEFRESAAHPQRRGQRDTPAIADSSKDREEDCWARV